MTDQGDSAGSGKGFASRFSGGGSFTQRSGSRRGSAAGAPFAKLVEGKNSKPAVFSESKDILKTTKATKEGFASATRKSRLDCLFLVRGKDKGRAAWHYVLVDKGKREMFLAKSKSGSMDVALYGEILYSGWGENPPDDVVKRIEEEFGS
ncbi:hypothetical protein [Anaplasma capra]|uniref:hypothetical protein n=1 Tax=Anaplasma capra TaxID=1562740 RepID=UPI0021D58E0A|nr:hypothetical protein [Anaplasma capra]MCU7611583.1 hypothetical protein [Anaplasma capra]MCU7611978.1 hypothetical protein [Anaplasma capra]